MSAIEKLLSRVFRWYVIRPTCPAGKEGTPLMTRFYVFQTKPVAVYLHLFHRSDLDEFHDHPWSFLTFLLSSGYWEHLPLTGWCPSKPFKITGSVVAGDTGFRRWRRRFSVLYRPALFRHYVEVVKPTWTLVIRFRRIRDWGFWSDGKWHFWKTFDESGSRSICEDVKTRDLCVNRWGAGHSCKYDRGHTPPHTCTCGSVRY